jgi:phospholipid transport system transporter-binding protein
MNIAAEGKVVRINGELSFATVPLLSKSNRSLIQQNPYTIFDLSQITSSDNTGVALLVSLASFAKSIRKEVAFTNLPKQLLDLVEAVGVREILPII